MAGVTRFDAGGAVAVTARTSTRPMLTLIIGIAGDGSVELCRIACISKDSEFTCSCMLLFRGRTCVTCSTGRS